MGYMGFGMRKEVYTRKPKKPFKRSKETSIPTAKDGSEAGHNASQTYQKIRFRPLRERRWFRLLSAAMIIFISVSVLNITVFDELRYLKKKHDFESAGVPGFYKDHQSAIDSLMQYLHNRESKIAGIDGHKMTLRSKSYNQLRSGRSVNAHHRGLDYFGRTVNMEIVKGNLKFPLHDFYRTFKEYWSCDVLVNELNKLDSSFFIHLSTEKKTLEAVVKIVTDNGLRISSYEHGQVLSFDKFNHTYNIIYSDSISFFQHNGLNAFQPINEKLFWIESKLYSDVTEPSLD